MTILIVYLTNSPTSENKMSEVNLVKVCTGKIYCPYCGTKLISTDFPCHDYCEKCGKVVAL